MGGQVRAPAIVGQRRPRLSTRAGRSFRAGPAAALTPALAEALGRAHYIYLTTHSKAGKPGTVPTWCWLHEDAVYFTTQRKSLKARRIAKSERVTVHVGRKDGPAFEGRAELVEDRRDLEKAILAAYHRKYWVLVPLWMGRYLRKGLEARTSVLVRVRPSPR